MMPAVLSALGVRARKNRRHEPAAFTLRPPPGWLTFQLPWRLLAVAAWDHIIRPSQVALTAPTPPRLAPTRWARRFRHLAPAAHQGAAAWHQSRHVGSTNW